MKYKKVKIIDIIEFQRGKDLTKENMENGEYPVVGSNGIIGYHNKYTTDEPSISIGRSGNVGRPFITHSKSWTHNTALYVKEYKNIYSYFVYYLLKNLNLEEYGSGSTVPTLNRNDIHQLQVYIPEDIKYQEILTNIFLDIDRFIDLNTKINDNLEKQMKLLYDYWFVQFDFPDENGKPYKSSGGKMVWNDKLKRDIPENWSIKKLSEICKIVLGGTPSTDIKKYWNGNINWLNSGEVSQFPIVTSSLKISIQGIENSSTKLMPIGTTIISITGNIRASILAVESCANQSVVGIIGNKDLKYPFIYQYILRMIDMFISISSGNCQKHINKNTIENTLIFIPEKYVLNKYYFNVFPLYEKMFFNSLENKKLTELRDFLLPLLMNGQATISE